MGISWEKIPIEFSKGLKLKEKKTRLRVQAEKSEKSMY